MILNDREMEETDALYNKKKTKIKLKKRISLVGSLVIILVVILWGIRRIFYDINSVYDVYLTTSQYESWAGFIIKLRQNHKLQIYKICDIFSVKNGKKSLYDLTNSVFKINGQF